MKKLYKINNIDILSQFQLLSKEGILGFYNYCEIIEIVMFINNVPTNLFTIVTFEEHQSKLEESNCLKKSSFLNKERIVINKNITCGVCKYYRSVDKVKKHFEEFIKSGEWQLSGKTLKVAQFNILPKQYIPADGSYPTHLNAVLKNNFHNGSYIIECFDEHKTDVNFLLKKIDILKKISESIYEILPISLAKISDRLGNIIFQFPINIISTKSRLFHEEQEGIQVDMAWDARVKNRQTNCQIISISELDNYILGSGLKKIDNEVCKIVIGNASGDVKTILYDTSNQLILSYIAGSYIRTLSINMNITELEIRIFKTQNPTQSHKIKLKSHANSIHVGQKQSKNYIQWVNNRVAEEERKKLADNRSFVQYANKKNISEREKALADVRFLIERYGEKGVYLWDPYLTAEDVINTLYFCSFYDAPLRAISSFDRDKNKIYQVKANDNLKTWIDNNKEAFLETNNHNNYGINLEFRVQHGQYGWKFHDRFLIFPDFDDKVKVWSLGTSVNSLGKEHHILQEIGNASHIFCAFNDLWNELEDSACLVWRKKPNE